jgi:hypothetical protein
VTAVSPLRLRSLAGRPLVPSLFRKVETAVRAVQLELFAQENSMHLAICSRLVSTATFRPMENSRLDFSHKVLAAVAAMVDCRSLQLELEEQHSLGRLQSGSVARVEVPVMVELFRLGHKETSRRCRTSRSVCSHNLLEVAEEMVEHRLQEQSLAQQVLLLGCKSPSVVQAVVVETAEASRLQLDRAALKRPAVTLRASLSSRLVVAAVLVVTPFRVVQPAVLERVQSVLA